jgi:hypothetical protein
MSTANQSVEASTQSLVGAMSGSAQNSSMAYAAQVNEVIIAYQDKVNAMLFGHWVNTTTVVLNETLVEFYDGVEQGQWPCPFCRTAGLTSQFSILPLAKPFSLARLTTLRTASSVARLIPWAKA